MEDWFVDEALIPAPFGGVQLTVRQDRQCLRNPALEIVLLPNRVPTKTPHSILLSQLAEHVICYLQRPQYVIPLLVTPSGTALQQRVWKAILNIPVRHTCSYTDIALQLGSHPRVIANACGANPLPLMIPCHRVLAKHGLGGFMRSAPRSLEIKHWLLHHEQSTS